MPIGLSLALAGLTIALAAREPVARAVEGNASLQPPGTTTVTPTPPSTATATPTPTNTSTPSPVCQGDETMSFDPAASLVGDPFVILVSSAKPHVNVRLDGPFSPAYLDARPGGLGFVWRWEAIAGAPGTAAYDFYAQETELCTSGSVAISAAPTPTATETLTPSPSPSLGPPTATDVPPTDTPSPSPTRTPTRTTTPVVLAPLLTPLPATTPVAPVAGGDLSTTLGWVLVTVGGLLAAGGIGAFVLLLTRRPQEQVSEPRCRCDVKLAGIEVTPVDVFGDVVCKPIYEREPSCEGKCKDGRSCRMDVTYRWSFSDETSDEVRPGGIPRGSMDREWLHLDTPPGSTVGVHLDVTVECYCRRFLRRTGESSPCYDSASRTFKTTMPCQCKPKASEKEPKLTLQSSHALEDGWVLRMTWKLENPPELECEGSCGESEEPCKLKMDCIWIGDHKALTFPGRYDWCDAITVHVDGRQVRSRWFNRPTDPADIPYVLDLEIEARCQCEGSAVDEVELFEFCRWAGAFHCKGDKFQRFERHPLRMAPIGRLHAQGVTSIRG